MLAATSARADERPAAAAARLQAIVDQVRTQLAIPQNVTVVLVPKNPLMASVERVNEGEAFVLSIERAFASGLTEDELEGVIAHELGHVWIFTHHPYLQTEQLANRIAMRLVSRESLERVYEKVWKGGAKGDLSRFLGEPAVREAASAVASANAPAKAVDGVSIRK
jgi:hypothetical protein